jgi:hypothetical protein
MADETKTKIKYLNNEIKTTLSFSFLGIIVGYLSFLISNRIYGLVFAIVVLYAAMIIFKKLFNIKERLKSKWWLSNAVIVYIFIWLIVWSIFITLNM